ncbi:hypothetical protein P3S67_000527 [Capsicum chacoense]
MGQPSKIKRVTTYEKAHSCSVDFIMYDHRNATSKVICDYILELVRDSSNIITPKFMVDEMRRKYGIIISYNKGWGSIQHAYTVIRGTAKENYNRLPSYLHMIKENNRGTYTNIKREDDNRFQYAFFAYGASIIGWTDCRPVIIEDVTFLKSKSCGVLMIAVSKNGNNNIFPLAFGIVDSENNESYKWFFNQLRNAIGCQHRIWIYHMEKNLRKKYFLDVVLSLFYNATTIYKQTKFYTFTDEIEKVNKVAVKYLKEEEPESWTRLFHTNKRYNMLTTNDMEYMNEVLRKARQLPMLY